MPKFLAAYPEYQDFGINELRKEEENLKKTIKRLQQEIRDLFHHRIYQLEEAQRAERINEIYQKIDRINQKNKDLEARRARLQKRQSHSEGNLAMQNQIYGDSRTGVDPHSQGAMGEASHLASLNAEGVAAKLIAFMLLNFFQLLFSMQYRKQRDEFAKAREYGIAYEPNEKGELPRLYHVDGRGKVNFARPYQNNELPSRRDIRANGFVPPPCAKEAFVAQLAQFKVDMHGTRFLTPEEKEILFRKIGNEAEEGQPGLEGNQMQDDNAARMMAMNAAKRPAS